MVREERVKYLGKSLIIRYVANHYYIQIILSGEQQRIEYIKHIVQTPREIQFLNHLEDYVKQTDNKFNDFDWWMFSKLDESLDRVYIPSERHPKHLISARMASGYGRRASRARR